MINELYELSKAIEQAGVTPQQWHREYMILPKIRKNAPCIKIMILDGQIVSLSTISEELGANLRKFGSNAGTYPCMNLVPLYRVTDEDAKKAILEIKPESLDAAKIEMIRSLCTENNWSSFQRKYNVSMTKVPETLKSMLGDACLPLSTIIAQTDQFSDSTALHKALEACVFEMLRNKTDIALALQVLFHLGNDTKDPQDDRGTLSVVFDTPLLSNCIPVASLQFTQKLNGALLAARADEHSAENASEQDAFSIPFQPVDEPMPTVQLAGGPKVSLRTMFEEQPCQFRYGKAGSKSYPASPQLRQNLHAALQWIGGSIDDRDKTWINTDKNEVMFVYPSVLPKEPVSCTAMFKRPTDKSLSFKQQSKIFLSGILHGKAPGDDSNAMRIRIFIVRKIDNGRSKVVYTRQTDPFMLEKYSEAWVRGCGENLPSFPFGQPEIPFPLDPADALNRFWKQSGELVTSKFKPVPKYHGLELFLDANTNTQYDMHTLVQSGMILSGVLGKYIAQGQRGDPIFEKVKENLALMGLLLYRADIRKEKYMEDLPYLYGQLLKASDELHALYCNVVRDGEMPTQLAGGSLYQAASETPVRTLNVLGQRMNPYILWAKTYRYKNVEVKGKESWHAGWLLSIFEQIATKLNSGWTPDTRLDDAEKAQLFIGYLAAFPKKEQNVKAPVPIYDDEEEQQ